MSPIETVKACQKKIDQMHKAIRRIQATCPHKRVCVRVFDVFGQRMRSDSCGDCDAALFSACPVYEEIGERVEDRS